MTRLAGKTALVTGASRGIGRGIAEAMAAEGATVAVNHLPDDQESVEAAAVVETIEDDGGAAMRVAGNVSEEESVRAMVDTVEEAFGGTPDILVNNAGVVRQSRLVEMSVEEWDEIISVDLRGVFLTTRFVVPGMLSAGAGAVINVASQLGFKGAVELTHYSAAKGGVIAFTRALAREVSPTVTVNAVAPGPVETDLLGDLTEEWRRSKEAELPMDRLGQVGDIAPTAVFLASDDGDYYTGQTLSPDGGDAMH
jgi:3-oxoacyl-[acyl-carrier protein] reductase